MRTTDDDASLSNLKDAYRNLVAEVSQLRRAKRVLDAKLEKAEAARELVRQLIAAETGERIDEHAAATGQPKKKSKRKGFHTGSRTAEVVERSKRILLSAGKPLQRAELLERIEGSGFLLDVSDPPRFVGRTLWDSDDFIHIEKRGYWLAGENIPEETE
ncbi:hypothetical protein QTL95_21230 [Rhizobium sp. S152]|uniref:hypothetical protein n=1 Tax=Rhizobium sp. S152 TaxID=3055038 RepID=UPI0025A93575|nr:hypothetical protein [Rhizobium sp. S152]MDM9628424.1 hypothetical protein [Rhizobium sp. S152]